MLSERLTVDELERRHQQLRRERLEIYMQLKDLPPRDIRMLYWEWGIPLTEKSRMQNLVMHKLWLSPEFADKVIGGGYPPGGNNCALKR